MDNGQIYSVQFSSRWYLCAWKSPYALHPVSQKFPQRCIWNSSKIRVIDDGLLSSYQRRLSSISFSHASLLQVIDGVMPSALCPQVVSQAPRHFRPSEKQATCDGCFARQSICPGWNGNFENFWNTRKLSYVTSSLWESILFRRPNGSFSVQ